MSIKYSQFLQRAQCPKCGFTGPDPIFAPAFLLEFWKTLNQLSSGEIHANKLNECSGDELLGLYLHVRQCLDGDLADDC